MPTLLAEQMLNNTPSFCNITYSIVTDMATTIGGGAEAYMFIYIVMLIFLPMAVFGISRNPLFGLLGGLAGHLTVMLLASASCLPLPTEYLVAGNFVFLMLAGIMLYIWKVYKGGQITW